MAIPDKAITRNEQYLAAMAGQSGTLPDAPITRRERYLAKAAGQDVETPPPITREEKYLDVIAEGGGGGGVTVNSLSVTENGTYTAPSGTAYSPVTVDVQGSGGYTNDDFADGTKPVGAVTFSDATTSATGYTYLLAHRTGITEVNFPNAILIPDYIVYDCTSLSTVTAPKAQILGAHAFENCSALQRIVFPVARNVYADVFRDCSNLIAADFGGTPASGEGFWRNTIFYGCSKLNILVIRGSAVWTLANIGVFTNSPFASGKAGGTLYVPSSLISSYQSATNWSTILGYANNSIEAIEGSIYETQYVDGTPIPTT